MPDTGFDLFAAARQEMIDEGFDPDFPQGVDEQVATLKARAFKSGLADSAVASRSYTIVPAVSATAIWLHVAWSWLQVSWPG